MEITAEKIPEVKKEKDKDIVALGELLIDFTEAGKSRDGMKLFEQNPGGAPANMLTAASHMGASTAMIGKVGADMHGQFLLETLKREGIDTSAVIKDPDHFTTLAFVELDSSGERFFSFARKPGADTMLRKEELDKELLSACKVFHFGSLSLTNEPSKSATLEAVRIAKEAGAVISYDPNYRPSLWSSREIAVEQMKSVIPMVDLLKASDEESLLLTGCGNSEEAADQLLSVGVKLAAITLGHEGVLIAGNGKKERIPARKVNPVDTTGAGDSFWGGFMSRFLSFGKRMDQLEWEQIRECAIVGNAAAALCIQKRGGIPSVPEREAIEELIREHRLELSGTANQDC